jgi:hypothetical protein
VTFFDADGTPINQTTWYPKRLTPNVYDQIVVNSTSPRAQNFEISFQKAR